MALLQESAGMIGISLWLPLLLLIVARLSDNVPVDCSEEWRGGMSERCCDCLGCDQGMRFGKRTPQIRREWDEVIVIPEEQALLTFLLQRKKRSTNQWNCCLCYRLFFKRTVLLWTYRRRTNCSPVRGPRVGACPLPNFRHQGAPRLYTNLRLSGWTSFTKSANFWAKWVSFRYTVRTPPNIFEPAHDWMSYPSYPEQLERSR